MICRKDILDAATAVGFNLCGTTHCGPMREISFFFEKWLSEGYGDTLGYLHRYTDRRADPRLLMEGAQTVVVCAVNYRNPLSGGYPDGFEGAKVASYAMNTDYHVTIKDMLRRMLNISNEEMPHFMDATDALGAAFCHFIQRGSPVSEKKYSSWADFVNKNPRKVK